MARKRQLRTPLNAISAKLKRLLYMEYRPSELADELGLDIQDIYKYYMPKGCPYTKDDTGHVWIVGTEFRTWFEATLLKSRKDKA